MTDMEKEVESLKRDKMDLEFHIERTSVWCDNTGKWTASVDSAEVRQFHLYLRPLPHLCGSERFMLILYQVLMNCLRKIIDAHLEPQYHAS